MGAPKRTGSGAGPDDDKVCPVTPIACCRKGRKLHSVLEKQMVPPAEDSQVSLDLRVVNKSLLDCVRNAVPCCLSSNLVRTPSVLSLMAVLLSDNSSQDSHHDPVALCIMLLARHGCNAPLSLLIHSANGRTLNAEKVDMHWSTQYASVSPKTDTAAWPQATLHFTNAIIQCHCISSVAVCNVDSC